MPWGVFREGEFWRGSSGVFWRARLEGTLRRVVVGDGGALKFEVWEGGEVGLVRCGVESNRRVA